MHKNRIKWLVSFPVKWKSRDAVKDRNASNTDGRWDRAGNFAFHWLRIFDSRFDTLWMEISLDGRHSQRPAEGLVSKGAHNKDKFRWWLRSVRSPTQHWSASKIEPANMAADRRRRFSGQSALRCLPDEKTTVDANPVTQLVLILSLWRVDISAPPPFSAKICRFFCKSDYTELQCQSRS